MAAAVAAQAAGVDNCVALALIEKDKNGDVLLVSAQRHARARCGAHGASQPKLRMLCVMAHAARMTARGWWMALVGTRCAAHGDASVAARWMDACQGKGGKNTAQRAWAPTLHH